ncbi:SMI1/KNR4 family protein [Algibacter lectus]|uniref:SMI1/KNR4 family protein n=1 Tax=Algibacter lectus TaxID=221126 RepID=UPI0005A85856|nr:SMI1/KNR4 family protein [Algibacter lectus]
MLSNKIKNHLEENKDDFIKYTPSFQEKLREYAISKGLKIESSFVDFMSTYDGEILGEEGLIINALRDYYSYENSTIELLRQEYGVPKNYLTLFNTEVDDYLLYNMKNDSVKLIEAQNMKELSNDEYYDEKWDSFNEFLEHFFELN